MKPFLRFLFLLATLAAGCARLATPNAPDVMTVGGHRCVQQCQAIHDRCVANVNRALGESYWNFANPQMGSCNDNLGACYATCRI